jgi:adenylate cyclase
MPSPRSGPPIVVDPLPSDGTARLIGRDAERAQLLQSITDASSGRGTVLVLSGEAGIGKSRLASEALDAARRLGCQTLVGRCHEQEGMPPLIPYIELLEEASRLMAGPVFRHAVAPSAPELAQLLPQLHRLFPDMESPLELPPELRQRFLFTNVREFFTRCSRAAPLVLFLDDIQWADQSTLQLTQHLAQHLTALPMVIIAACRDIESAPSAAQGALQSLFDRVRGQGRRTRARMPHAVRETLAELTRQGRARTIDLGPLGEGDVRSMLAALGHGDPPAAMVRRFVDQTGGNPLFVAELFRHLQEEGRLFDPQRRWKRDLEFGDGDIPKSARAVLERRLHRVSEATRDVLKAAAVIGPHFELDLLERVGDADTDRLIAALDEAEQARLVRGPSGRQEVMWRFAHDLIRQALTGAIPQLRRQRLHLRVADAMERLDASTRPYTAEIAHHLYSAGQMAERTRTAQALMMAGDAAYAVYATEEAVRHYHRALEVVEDSGAGHAMRHGVEERLADLLALLGDRGEAVAHYRSLARVHEERQSRVEQARIARKLGTLHWQEGNRTRAMECYERALEVLDSSAAHIESAHLYQELGLAAFRTGDNRQAIDWARRALQAAETALGEESSVTPDVRKEASIAIAHATNTIGVALARLGQLDAAREHIERSVSVARQLGLLDVVCRAYANLGVLYSTVEPKSAIDVSITGLELASKIGAASLQSYLYANLAAAYCALTDRCETKGLEAAQAGANLDRALGQLDHLAVPLIVIAQIHQCQGELGKAQEAYQEALALAERIGEPQLILPCYDGLATICLDRGDKIRAERYMEQARDLCDRSGIDPEALLLLPFLC